MAKKQQFKLIGESFEKELIEVIDKRIEENNITIAEKDISIIMMALMPDIDKLISDKIKSHMKFLGEALISKLKEE